MCLDHFIGVRFKSRIVFNLRKNFHNCLSFKISYSFIGQIIKASKEFNKLKSYYTFFNI